MMERFDRRILGNQMVHARHSSASHAAINSASNSRNETCFAPLITFCTIARSRGIITAYHVGIAILFNTRSSSTSFQSSASQEAFEWFRTELGHRLKAGRK